MTEAGDAMKTMAERFLAWKLPADFYPDGGIIFVPIINDAPWKAGGTFGPTGTNLLTYTQARAMVEQMADGINFSAGQSAAASEVAALREENARLREALRTLVFKIDETHDHSSYQNVWAVAQLHVGPYTGPQYGNELSAARAILSRSNNGDA